LDPDASENLIKRLWAIAHSFVFFFFCFFFSLLIFRGFGGDHLFSYKLFAGADYHPFTVALVCQEETEAGSAEEQPARDIAGIWA
jgi:hypothetical protein